MESNETQTPPAVTPAPPAGKTVEQLQAEMESLKRESEGRLRDLQSERVKRQELEERHRAPAPSAEVTPNDVPQDELGKVLKPYMAPLENRVRVAEAIAAETINDKAMTYLMAKTGKSKQQIIEDQDLQNRLGNVARRYGFAGNNYDVTVKAYDIMELEKLRADEAERRRSAEVNANASLPAGTPPPPVTASKLWDKDQWSAMPLYEYEKLASAGSFHENADGKIVFTPNK